MVVVITYVTATLFIAVCLETCSKVNEKQLNACHYFLTKFYSNVSYTLQVRGKNAVADPGLVERGGGGPCCRYQGRHEKQFECSNPT